MIYDDENPSLTKQDRLNIEKEINHTEYDQRLDTQGAYEGIRTTLNKDFQAAANERLKQKHKEALIKLERKTPSYNPAEDRSGSSREFMESGNRKYDPFVDDFDSDGEFSTRMPGQDPDDPGYDLVLPGDEDSPFKQCAKSEGGSGCIKSMGGVWKVISNKTGKPWPAKYKSKSKAEGALKAYHS